ncbi:uncharacterized protein LOC119107788 [Pollicipes pollicipes]|uniref:uncharacterized protein LOC119107788 n=1 Tax=Pollicipes pollicipes TaxID=41117 RepID=UPI001884E566|nr:uncharacterized protein LOC119107788 [Pollicipes pollicipes]
MAGDEPGQEASPERQTAELGAGQGAAQHSAEAGAAEDRIKPGQLKTETGEPSADDKPEKHGITPELVQTFLDRFLPAGNRSVVKAYKYWPVATLGEGYTTVRKVLEVTYCDEVKEKEEVVNFVVKLPGGMFVKECRDFGLYEREVVMYAQVVEVFRQLLTSRGQPVLLPFARLAYGTMLKDGQILDERGQLAADQRLGEMMVLEMLTGYEVVDKKVGFDLDHVRLVLPAMARFHAMGYVLHQKHSERADRLRSVRLEMPDDLSQFGLALKPILAVLEHEGLLSEAAAVDRVTSANHFIDGFNRTFTEDLDVVTLVHGDLWISNMMFKYRTDEDGVRHPEDIKFLDLQTSRFGDPAFDIIYCMLTSTRRALRRQHFRDMLSWYVAAFRTQLEELGEKPDQLAPWLSVDRLYSMYGNALSNSWIQAEQVVQMLFSSEEDRSLIFSSNDKEAAPKAIQTMTERWLAGKCTPELTVRILEIIDELEEFGCLK